MKRSGSLVVKHHTPWQKATFWLVLSSVVLGGGYGLYVWGQQEAGHDRIEASQLEDNMSDAIRHLERENNGLRDKVALLEQGNQVDKQAYSNVDSELKRLQEEVLELREEVSFYRGIVSPTESSSGLRIENFVIKNAGQERVYHYKLVLTQVLKNNKTARGQVKLQFEGVQNGRSKTLSLLTVSSKKLASYNYKFRYFQRFEEDILLPQDFIPRSVTIKLDPHRGKEIERAFDWPMPSTEDAKSADTVDGGGSEEAGAQ